MPIRGVVEVRTGRSLDGLQRVYIPVVDVFGRPVTDVPFGFHTQAR